MKAFVVDAPGSFGVREVPMPRIRDDELLVKVGAAALCHSDLDIINGNREHLVRYPNILGHEFAGTVVEVGRSAIEYGFKVGDRITPECMLCCGTCRFCASGHTEQCDNFSELGTMRPGGFAEYVAVPFRAAHRFTSIEMTAAALTECAGNGHKAARCAQICPGDTVLIVGPGPIGIFAMHFARLAVPCRILMAGTRDSRLKFAVAADEKINVTAGDAASRIMELTDGRGVDVIIQCATTAAAFELMLKVAGKRCRICIEGLPNDRKILPVDFSRFVTGPMSIMGMTGAAAADFNGALRAFERGAIDPCSVITDVMPLEKIEDGLRLLTSKAETTLKVVITP